MLGPYHYNSLEDFLISTTLTVDGQVNDGSGRPFPVKGREIEATVLFSDIAGFSARTLDLNPAETLAFVNHFFAWVGRHGAAAGLILRGTEGEAAGRDLQRARHGEFARLQVHI